MFARERGRVPHKAKAKPKDTKLFASFLSDECFGRNFFLLEFLLPVEGRAPRFRLKGIAKAAIHPSPSRFFDLR